MIKNLSVDFLLVDGSAENGLISISENFMFRTFLVNIKVTVKI